MWPAGYWRRMKIEAVLFDLDGTLFDTDDVWLDGLLSRLGGAQRFRRPGRWLLTWGERLASGLLVALDSVNLDDDVDRLAARLLAACQVSQVGPDIEADLVTGCVGEAAGLEFISWKQSLDLQDPEELLRDPASYRHPARGDQVYATLAAVAAAVVARPTAERWAAAWDVLARAVGAGSADMAAAAARSLVHARRPEWPLPVDSVRSLAPVLRAAGVM